MLQTPEVEYGKRVRILEHATLGTERVANAAVTPTSHAVQHGESTVVSQAADLRFIAVIQTGHVGKDRIHTSNEDYHGKRSLGIANLRKTNRSNAVVDILGVDVRTEASGPHHGTARSGKVRLGMHLPAAYPWRSSRTRPS